MQLRRRSAMNIPRGCFVTSTHTISHAHTLTHATHAHALENTHTHTQTNKQTSKHTNTRTHAQHTSKLIHEHMHTRRKVVAFRFRRLVGLLVVVNHKKERVTPECETDTKA